MIKDPLFRTNRQATAENQNIIDENSTSGNSNNNNNIVANSSQHSEYKAVRYLNDNNSELYKKYSSACDYRISKSTFENYLNSSMIFKKPHRDTDLCEYCEEQTSIKEKIRFFLETEINALGRDQSNFEIWLLDNFDYQKLFEYFKSKLIELNLGEFTQEQFNERRDKYENFITSLKTSNIFALHQKIAEDQRLAYNFQRKNVQLLNTRILIDVDFKQKIVIGKLIILL